MREKLNALFKRRRAYAQLRLESTSITEIRELEKAIDDFTIRIQITEKKLAEQRSKAIRICAPERKPDREATTASRTDGGNDDRRNAGNDG